MVPLRSVTPCALTYSPCGVLISTTIPGWRSSVATLATTSSNARGSSGRNAPEPPAAADPPSLAAAVGTGATDVAVDAPWLGLEHPTTARTAPTTSAGTRAARRLPGVPGYGPLRFASSIIIFELLGEAATCRLDDRVEIHDGFVSPMAPHGVGRPS
ncbi:hypothetical protein GCM10023215_39380 [Pseudonocardia yuanmonensis]|uniref:Uncharacterized protein n=1 Tax=Pseudonocardia yuanmonensis TaxID=1095914 RepID=A0ABP8WXQ1_9PSEU